MKTVSTRDFRRELADYLAKAAIETIYIERPGNRLLQLVAVPEKDVDSIKHICEHDNR